MVEVGLFGDLAGQPRGLLAVPQAALPGAPLQRGGECRGGRTGEQHGRAGVPALPAAGQDAHRGQRHIGLGGGPLGGDRGVTGPPGVVLGRGVRPCGGALRVAGRLQLVLDGGGETVVAADRGDQAAGQQLAEGGVGVGVLGEGRQVRLVRQLAAERDGEAQRLLGGGAEPCGEQRGGGGGLPEGRQQHLGALTGLGVGAGGVGGRPLLGEGGRPGEGGCPRLGEQAVAVVEGSRPGPHPVVLPQQGGGLDEPQRQPLGLEPEVGGPGLLVVGERPVHGTRQQPGAGVAAESAEEDLFEVGVGAGGRDIGGGGDQEGAFGGGVEQLVERGAAEFQVVQDDDGADLGDHAQQFGPVGAVLRGPVDGGEQLVQQVGGGAVVAGEPDDAVGGEVGAAGGDGVQQPGAARAGGAGDAHGAAAGEQPDEAFGVLGALFERGLRGRRIRAGPGAAGARRRGRPRRVPAGRACRGRPGARRAGRVLFRCRRRG